MSCVHPSSYEWALFRLHTRVRNFHRKWRLCVFLDNQYIITSIPSRFCRDFIFPLSVLVGMKHFSSIHETFLGQWTEHFHENSQFLAQKNNSIQFNNAWKQCLISTNAAKNVPSYRNAENSAGFSGPRAPGQQQP